MCSCYFCEKNIEESLVNRIQVGVDAFAYACSECRSELRGGFGGDEE